MNNWHLPSIKKAGNDRDAYRQSDRVSSRLIDKSTWKYARLNLAESNPIFTSPSKKFKVFPLLMPIDTNRQALFPLAHMAALPATLSVA